MDGDAWPALLPAPGLVRFAVQVVVLGGGTYALAYRAARDAGGWACSAGWSCAAS